ncbi:MAG: hypothetical protein KVP17_002733 [Porospora cf. gigantea B]|uniref:uncharacterized protein n=1 Tax=Porospora cf. gigantea B TaxID=2853592 RepID=UPI003571EEF9|nr:MAG: hypothetical protein KVP17_002733 [Porospora cf. gigantea B]
MSAKETPTTACSPIRMNSIEIHFGPDVGRDPNDECDDIPPRFVQGTCDLTEARRRWQLTKKWRAAYGTDDILTEASPHYFIVKDNYPQYILGRSKEGRLVWFERPGKGRLNTLLKNGVTLHDMARHYILTTEYLWRVAEPRDDAQIISVFDLTGCRLADLAGNTLKLFKMSCGLIADHYPERSQKVIMINAPWFFQAAFAIVSPFIDPVTKNKIEVLSTDYQPRLLELVDADQLPPLLGGTGPEPDQFPHQIHLRNLVSRTLEALGVDPSVICPSRRK